MKLVTTISVFSLCLLCIVMEGVAQCTNPFSAISEDFDQVGSGNVPSCWFAEGNFTVSAEDSRSGSQSLKYTKSSSSPEQSIVLPEVSTLADKELRFFVKAGTGLKTLKIFARQDQNTKTNADLIQQISVPNSVNYQEFIVDFSSYAGPNRFVAIEVSQYFTSNVMYFDDISLGVVPELLSRFPENGQLNIDSLATISFKFASAVEQSSLAAGISVSGAQQGAISGSFSLPQPDSVVFTPASPYFANDQVTVKTTSSLKSAEGLDGLFSSFNFRVAATQNGTYSTNFSTTALAAIESKTAQDIASGDLDGDGDLDIVAAIENDANNASSLVIYENTGGGQFADGVRIAGSLGAFDIELSDFDMDGDLDIVSVVRGTNAGLARFQNGGNLAFSPVNSGLFPGGNYRMVRGADFNKDGTIEFLTADFGSNEFTYVLDFNGNSSQGNIASGLTGLTQCTAAIPTDIDGDDTLDIVTIHLAGTNPGVTVHYGSIASNGSLSYSGMRISTLTPDDIAPFDIDQDGDIDIVYTSVSGSVVGLLENNGSGTFTDRQLAAGRRFHKLAIGDMDADGDFDVVSGTNRATNDIATLHVVRNPGSNSGWLVQTLPATNFNSYVVKNLALGDIDRDGDLDILSHTQIIPNGFSSLQFFVHENPTLDVNASPVVLSTIGDINVAEDNPVTPINVLDKFSDPESDPLTYSVSSSVAEVQVVISDDSIRFTIQEDYFGSAVVTLSANDGTSTTNLDFNLIVQSVNDVPSFEIGIDTLELNEDFSSTQTINLTVNQPANESGQTISYSVSPDVDFATVEIDANGVLTIASVKDGFGVATLTVTADDNQAENNLFSDELVLIINAVQDSPRIVNPLMDQTKDEDFTEFQIDLADTFQEPDGDSLSIQVDVLPTDSVPLVSAILSASTLTISSLEDRFGEASVVVTATDVDDNRISDTLRLFITAVNDAPQFTTSGDLTLSQNFTGTENVTVSPESAPFGESDQVITYSLSPTSVAFASIAFDSQTGEVSVTSIQDSFGTQQFTITADDGQAINNTFTQTFVIEIQENLAPVISSPIEDLVIPEDTSTVEVVDLSSVFSDPDGDPLTFSTRISEQNTVDLSITNDILSVVPQTNYNGTVTVTVIADDQSITTSTSFLITVTSVNDGPVSNVTIPDQTIKEDSLFTYQLPQDLFVDVDGDALSITLDSDIGWLGLQGNTLSGTPTNEDVGVETIEIMATDPEGLSASVTFLLTVENVNDPIESISLDNQQVPAESPVGTVIGMLSIEDPDENDQHTFSLAANDYFSIQDNMLQVARVFTSDEIPGGEVTVSITADDGNGSELTSDFVIVVTDKVLSISPVSSLNVYPNPASEFIKIGGVGLIESASIYTLNGEKIDLYTWNQDREIDIKSLPEGIYVLYLKTATTQFHLRFAVTR